MTSVKLIIELVPGDSHFVCIDDDDIATHVHRRTVAWLILPSASTTSVLPVVHNQTSCKLQL